MKNVKSLNSANVKAFAKYIEKKYKVNIITKSDDEYEDFVYSACMPDMNDPVTYWENFSKKQQKIVDWLAGRKKIQVIGKETELTLNVEGRIFINCDGKDNMPDGEVFTGPVEDSVNGHVYFSYPAIPLSLKKKRLSD